MPKVYYVGPGHDGLSVVGHDFVRDGDGIDVPDELAKELLARPTGDFQKSAPSRQEPRVETPKDKE